MKKEQKKKKKKKNNEIYILSPVESQLDYANVQADLGLLFAYRLKTFLHFLVQFGCGTHWNRSCRGDSYESHHMFFVEETKNCLSIPPFSRLPEAVRSFSPF